MKRKRLFVVLAIIMMCIAACGQKKTDEVIDTTEVSVDTETELSADTLEVVEVTEVVENVIEAVTEMKETEKAEEVAEEAETEVMEEAGAEEIEVSSKTVSESTVESQDIETATTSSKKGTYLGEFDSYYMDEKYFTGKSGDSITINGVLYTYNNKGELSDGNSSTYTWAEAVSIAYVEGSAMWDGEYMVYAMLLGYNDSPTSEKVLYEAAIDWMRAVGFNEDEVQEWIDTQTEYPSFSKQSN